MKEKDTKQKVEELKEAKIDEEALDDVAGGDDFISGIKILDPLPNSKPYKGDFGQAKKK